MELPAGPNTFTTLKSEVIHERPYLRFIKDHVRVNGVEKDYSYADIANGIGIVAINDKGEVALVGQWRYAIDQYTWEIPAGMRDGEEDPAETALRELEEEAGAKGETAIPLGSFFMESSSTTKVSYAFLVQDIVMTQQRPEDDERIEVVWLPLEEAIEKIDSGEIRDGLSVLGLLRAQAYLQSLE